MDWSGWVCGFRTQGYRLVCPFVPETSGQKQELKAEMVAPGSGIDLEFETDGLYRNFIV